MIRIQEPGGWTLVTHRDHARLAGRFATHWNNHDFAAPEPRGEVLTAVARHDDAWEVRDCAPCLTDRGLPSAFSRELAGTYSAFEEMDFEDYLAVRGRAAETVASDNPYAAILISMHTVNLLTERTDISALTRAQSDLLRGFIENQERRQRELGAQVDTDPEKLRRGFEFLQACDSLSLMVCARQTKTAHLRHSHPRRDGSTVRFECAPLGGDAYRLTPFPFDKDVLTTEVPARRVAGDAFPDQEAFRSAFAAAPIEPLMVKIVR